MTALARPTGPAVPDAPSTTGEPDRGRMSTLVLGALAAILLAAVALRLERYLAGRSLWLDESLLAINVIDRPLSRLADPLDLSQGAPFGFLAATKLTILALGKSELAFRLLSLVASIATLGFAAIVARRVTWGVGVLLSLALLAVSTPLVYYAAEFKQYSVEVAAVTGLTAAAITAGRLTARRYLVVCGLAAALLWFAFTTVFFVTAFALVYGVAFLLERRWRDLAIAAAGSLAWLASGLAVYKISYADLGALEPAVATATGGGSGDSRPEKLAEAGGRILAGATGVVDAAGAEKLVLVLAFVLCAVGAVMLLRSKPYACLMLGLPIVFVFGGVAIGRYPVFERTMLVCVPGVAILVGHGAATLCRRFRRPVGVAAGVALSAVLLALPVKAAVESIGDPSLNNQGQRPLLEQLVREWQPGDALYVHYAAQYALRYYAECDCLGDGGTPPPPLSYATRKTIGRNLWHNALRSWPPHLYVGFRQDHAEDEWDDYLAEVERLDGRPRVWVLTSHWESPEEEQLVNVRLPRRLAELGTLEETFEEGTGRLSRYDLSGG